MQAMGLELRNKSKEVDKLQKKLRTLQGTLLAQQQQQDANAASELSKVCMHQVGSAERKLL